VAAQRHHHLHAALCTKDTAHRAHRYDNVSDEALRSQAQAGSAKTNSTARLLCLRWQWHPCLFSCCASPWTVKARWSQARQGKGTATDRSASGVTQHPGRAPPTTKAAAKGLTLSCPFRPGLQPPGQCQCHASVACLMRSCLYVTRRQLDGPEIWRERRNCDRIPESQQ